VRKEAETRHGLLPDNRDALIPKYPGRQLDPRGASSILTQRVHQNM